jgi:hypothetical protein
MSVTETQQNAIPDGAAAEVEFISQIHTNTSTELAPLPIKRIDVAYLKRYVAALEDADFGYTLVPYGSASADSFVLASAVGQLSDPDRIAGTRRRPAAGSLRARRRGRIRVLAPQGAVVVEHRDALGGIDEVGTVVGP